MGQQFALVSMTNKDVYNVSIEAGNEILRRLRRPLDAGFFETVDIKQHAKVSIAVAHVSSVVVREGGYSRG